MPTVIANRYARALADVVATADNYRQVLDELEAFAAVYHQSADLREVCETPAVAVAKKLGVLDAVVGQLGSSHATLNFLRVLLSHYRLPLLDEIVQAYRKVCCARMGIVEVKISSAAGLTDQEQELLRARFNDLTRQQSELEFHVDGNLIGGILAQIGSTVYDGSIRGNLDRIREQLMER